MSLRLNVSELEKMMKLFYDMSGIRIVLIDESYREVLAYPKEKCPFCREIHSNPNLSAFCDKCDIHSYEESRKMKDIYIYKCHMGLTEATFPLMHYQNIIGYVMFGQITDIKNKNKLEEFVNEVNNKYNTNCTAKGLKYRNKKQINAAAKLLEICSEYILLKELAAPQENRIMKNAKEYINKNLSDSLLVCDICKYTGVGRTELYQAFSRELGMGVAAYIRKERLLYAHKLLKTTSFSVSEISDRVGFSDYNYFSRIFKKEYGISPHKVRHQN